MKMFDESETLIHQGNETSLMRALKKQNYDCDIFIQKDSKISSCGLRNDLQASLPKWNWTQYSQLSVVIYRESKVQALAWTLQRREGVKAQYGNN